MAPGVCSTKSIHFPVGVLGEEFVRKRGPLHEGVAQVTQHSGVGIVKDKGNVAQFGLGVELFPGGDFSGKYFFELGHGKQRVGIFPVDDQRDGIGGQQHRFGKEFLLFQAGPVFTFCQGTGGDGQIYAVLEQKVDGIYFAFVDGDDGSLVVFVFKYVDFLIQHRSETFVCRDLDDARTGRIGRPLHFILIFARDKSHCGEQGTKRKACFFGVVDKAFHFVKVISFGYFFKILYARNKA